MSNAFVFQTPCTGCGNMTITLGDGRCSTCGHRKVSPESAELMRARRTDIPARRRWRWARTLTLMAFAIALAVILISIERIVRP
jgi:hypothetical protein